jgi:hypothetical protein
MENILKLYYTPISVKTLCNNGSERFGANATTTLSFDPNKTFTAISIYGKTKVDAERKLMEFLSDDENVLLELVEPKESEVSNG